MLLHNPDVLLLAGFFEPEVLQVLASLGKPMALVDLWAPGHRTVNPDNIGGGYTVTRHLLEQGCKRIAYLSGPLAHYSIQQRERGYRQALFDAGIPGDPSLEAIATLRADGTTDIEAATQQLLDLPTPPDAIFAYNDNAALIAPARLP